MRRKSNRPVADWVYRANRYQLMSDPGTDSEGGSDWEREQSGTYYNPIEMSAGPEGSTAQVLYDSAQYTGGRMGAGINEASGNPTRLWLGAEARPDMNRKGALIHGVELGIYMHVDPAIWTLATAHLYMAWRIVVARQDADDGRALLDPSYEMWGNFTGWQSDEPAVYANGRQNCAEGRYFAYRRTEETGKDVYIHRPFIKVRRRLDEHEGLFLYLELHSNSVALTGQSFVNLWCRTLVTDSNR